MSEQEFKKKALSMGYDEAFCKNAKETLERMRASGVDKTYDDVLLVQQTGEEDDDKFSSGAGSIVVIK